MRLITTLVLFAPLLLSGCSVYPLPQDSTGSTTADIVRNMRCEARSAVQDETFRFLESYGNRLIYRHSVSGVDLARLLRNKQVAMSLSILDNLDAEVAKQFNYYKHTQLALDFTLAGSEMNKQGVSFGLTKGISAPTDAIQLAGTATRMREVDRKFVTIDTFEYLALKIPDAYCEAAAKRINIVYPLEGKLPIYELIRSYIDLNSLGSLHNSGEVGKPEGTKSEVATPTMADTIMFTTALESDVDPRLNYNPLAKVFTLTSLGITNDNSRQDKHQVIATLITAPVNTKTKQGPSDDALRVRSQDAIAQQREKLVQDAIISIGTALSQPGSAGFSTLLR